MGNRDRNRSRSRELDSVYFDSDSETTDTLGLRRERLQKLLSDELSSVLRYEVADPDLANVRFASVELSPDYRNVRVGYVILSGGASRADVVRGFARAAGFFRVRVREAVMLKRAPDVSFFCLGEGVVRAEPVEHDPENRPE